MKHQLYASVAVVALSFAGTAHAQSTGTIDAEEIVVTASKTQDGVLGVVVPDTPKARTVLTQETIQTQSSGQSIINVLNIVPSVNFTNNDAYGSSGGNIRIRGFDGNRISLTWDGVPLNDTGNYAIFSNQTLDPEIIDQVNVNLGTTDVDSPTASAAGGTINYRTAVPSENLGALLSGSVGTFNFSRLFARIDSGSFTKFGTRLFVSASISENDKFKGSGKIDKKQYNFRVYQPLSGNNFISVAGHINKNRNNFYRNLNLATAFADLRDGKFNYDNNAACARPTFVGGTAQSEAATPQPSTSVPTNLVTLTGLDNSCSNYAGVRINPSNTGNIRINSKFELTDKITLTVDPSYQYVLANGGGFATISETDNRVKGAAGVAGPGKDLSGDGDTLDTVAFYSPNNTNTNRYGLLASLRWDFAEGQSIRVAYAYDRGRHRQTAELGVLDALGNPENVFGGRVGRTVTGNDGALIRQRDRLSIALLNQLSAEYRGKFFDDKLDVLLGIRSPWFKRELDQRCFTQVSNGTQICTTQPLGTTPTSATNYVVPNTTTGTTPGLLSTAVFAPFKATYKFHKLLPNVGFTYRATDDVNVYASFAQGFSSPRTDNLYRAPFVGVDPETSNNVDVGVRFTRGSTQAVFGAFYNKFNNRIVTSFDPQQSISVDRNIGSVEIKGLEASLDISPYKWFSFRPFASYINAELKDNIALSSTVAIPTTGKKLVETPKYQYGYSARFLFDPISFRLNYKHVSSRFATDLNDLKVGSYDTFDLDARLSLKKWGADKVFVKINVHNLFNERYFGSISSQIALPTNTGAVSIPGLALNAAIPGGANPTFGINSPRAISATIQVGF